MIREFGTNNKRIAKNTIMLYFRMIFIMGVNLYTSRVVLDVLGAEDYGTYNVVGGVVTMLSFIAGSLSSATSRHLTFELGKEENGGVERLFRCSSTIFYIISIIILVLSETIGLWFIQTQLNIPKGREIAAFWVYQFSVIAFIISLLSISYNALIIAKERMNAFAYISIYDGIARLGVCFLLYIIPADHLILYAGLLTLTQLSVRILYTIYCKRNFRESNGRWLWDKKVSGKIFSYAGWTLSSHLAIVGYTQGISILLNIYFGPIVNASRAIATQVQSALSQLYSNFQIAIKPQVIKNYAQGNLEYMHSLVLHAGRLSFMLAIWVSIPIFTFAEYILNLWLVNPPEHVVSFVRITIIACVNNSLSQHTLMSIQANGDIRKFILLESGCLLTIVPIAWGLLAFYHVSPEIVICVYAIVEIVTQFVRVHYIYPKVHLNVRYFYSDILFPSLITLVLCCIPAYLLYHTMYPINFLSFVISILLLFFLDSIIIYFCGLKKSERIFIANKVIKLRAQA